MNKKNLNTTTHPTTAVHLIADFWDCSPEHLNNRKLLVALMKKAAKDSNATLLSTKSHQFIPQGVTAIALLQESHISLHTWPELGYVAIDILSCGAKMNPHRALEVLNDTLQPQSVTMHEVPRGFRSINNEK